MHTLSRAYPVDQGIFRRSIWCAIDLPTDSVTLAIATVIQSPSMAVFTLDNDRTRTVHFGSAGASDYTQHRDPARKQQYLARHAPREHWENPMTAGALARWILWNKETLHSSIQDYIRRFNLVNV